MRFSFSLLFFFSSLLACGAGGSSDAPPVVAVPSQPPPPAPPSPSSAPSSTPPPAPTSTPAVAVLPWKCDASGTQRYEIGGRSYCGYTEPETWDGSERRCVANGGHLMALDTSSRSEMIRRELGSPLGATMGRAAWIGIEKEKKPGQKWKWINGTEITAATANWNTNEPNNFDGNEACGEWLATDGRWNDTRCDLKQAFLCQESKADKPLDCSKGNAKAITAKGVRYCLNPTEKSFTDSKKACETSGGTLAIVKSKEESTAIKDALAQRFPAKRLWIGATDSPEEGTWTWTNGAKFEWDHWLPNEPNNFNREDCAELHAATWMWNDMDCAMKLPSVCEIAKR